MYSLPIGPFGHLLNHKSFVSLNKCVFSACEVYTQWPTNLLPGLGRNETLELWSSWLPCTLVNKYQLPFHEKEHKVQASENAFARGVKDRQLGTCSLACRGISSEEADPGDDQGLDYRHESLVPQFLVSVFIWCFLQKIPPSLFLSPPAPISLFHVFYYMKSSLENSFVCPILLVLWWFALENFKWTDLHSLTILVKSYREHRLAKR